MSQGSDLSASSTTTLTMQPADRHEVLYLAYGSNLSTRQMLARCPDSVPVGLGYLPGWRWMVNERGYANIVQQQQQQQQPQQQQQDQNLPASSSGDDDDDKGKGKQVVPEQEQEQEHERKIISTGVYGLLYLLPPHDEDKLDRCEGVPYAYAKEIVDVEMVPPSQSSSETQQQGAATPVRVRVVRALVYVDRERVVDDFPLEEYVDRMNVAIDEAVAEWGMPEWYVRGVMRRYVPDYVDEEMGSVEEEGEEEEGDR